MSEPKYLALDPGESTGWAVFDSEGSLEGYGTVKGREELYKYLSIIAPSVDTIIMEDYKLFPWKSGEQSWSTLNTVRYIGSVEYWAHTTDRRVVLQDPSIKTIAYKWAGINKPKRKDMTHETDAYVHGVYFLQKTGVRKPQQGKAVG